jgi:hypothetical protein
MAPGLSDRPVRGPIVEFQVGFDLLRQSAANARCIIAGRRLHDVTAKQAVIIDQLLDDGGISQAAFSDCERCNHGRKCGSLGDQKPGEVAVLCNVRRFEGYQGPAGDVRLEQVGPPKHTRRFDHFPRFGERHRQFAER